MRIAVVGATGLVGSVMLKVLEEQNLTVSELIPVASERSIGKMILFKGVEHSVVGMETAIGMGPEIALFSAGGATARQWAPKFVEAGATVIDNSSSFRMDEDTKLIVPEINAHQLTDQDKIIANPNCSTIQLVVALAPLHERYGIERLVISTYQSVSGTGVQAVEQLENERKGIDGAMAYPHPIDKNCLPHGGDLDKTGYTTEELKLVYETRKILGDDAIRVTATVVRVPVVGGHSESVNIEFKNDFELQDVIDILGNSPGIVVQNDLGNNEYPMPITAHGRDEVFVGRIRRDLSNPMSLNLWIVADNLRKGAATNAVQIAKYLVDNGLVGRLDLA